jgi:nitroimidazol reductase NimA-like FMN-containing flavoprotein (pyridoxamine 5'-phosphate oxidase superfamily)
MKPSRLDELSPAECHELLRSAGVGRLVFTEQAMPAAHPVNYLLDGDDIVVRTGPGAKLDAAARGDVLAFQVDHIDPETRAGWSVLVVGRASLVVDIDELVDLAEPSRRPWAEGRREHMIRIAGERITGRRLRLQSPG